MALAEFLYGGLWFSYGLAHHDPFIYAPNSLGAAFGLFQIVLIAVVRFLKRSKRGSFNFDKPAFSRVFSQWSDHGDQAGIVIKPSEAPLEP